MVGGWPGAVRRSDGMSVRPAQADADAAGREHRSEVKARRRGLRFLLQLFENRGIGSEERARTVVPKCIDNAVGVERVERETCPDLDLLEETDVRGLVRI